MRAAISSHFGSLAHNLLFSSCFLDSFFDVDDFHYVESDVSRYESPWVTVLGICWDSWLNVFHHSWETLATVFSALLHAPLSALTSPCACAGVPGGAPKSTEMLLILLHSFYFSSPPYILSVGLASGFLTLSSGGSDRLLGPSCEVSIAVIVLFNSRVSIWFYFYNFSVLLTFFPTSCTFPFILLFFFFGSLNIFLIANLKSLLGLLSELPQGYFLLMPFFLCMGYIFLICCMSHNFFVV